MEVELYGVLKEKAGTERVTLDLEDGATVGEVLAEVERCYPALAGNLERVACAVGDELVRRDTPLTGERPLVLLPPVSGG